MRTLGASRGLSAVFDAMDLSMPQPGLVLATRTIIVSLGMYLAALVSNALADEGIGFQVPWGQLVAFTIVALIAGVLAAIVPARRAAKLNVLRALQYE